MLTRFTSSLSKLHGIYRSARRRSRLSIGVAVVTVLAVTGVLVGVVVGSGCTASAASDGGALSKAKAARLSGSAATSPAATAGHRQARTSNTPKLAAKARPAHHAAAKHPAAKPSAKPAPKKPAAHSYTLYDSVTPSAIPAHNKIATYSNGSYAVRPQQVANRGPVLWIDVKGSDTAASVLDVEPGDATPTQAADWAMHKLSTQPKALACIYTMRSEWGATRAAIAKLPSDMCSRIRWWIADPTGVKHIVPGSQATQWYWGQNYDISSVTSSFPQLQG